MDSDPAIGLVPDQFPDAVQLLASVDDQFKVIALPRLTLDGLALSVTVGALTAGGSLTVTVALALPPAPLQSMKYVDVTAGLTSKVPAVAISPLQSPEAVQPVASLTSQLSVAVCP